MANKDARVSAAVSELRELVESRLAVSEIEAVARLIETHYATVPFEPHHLTSAKNILVARGEIVLDQGQARGGRDVHLLRVADTRARSRATEDAVARKRLLMARYYAWTQGTATTGEGLSGAAGELAVHAAIARSNVGMSLATTTRGRPEVSMFLGKPVPLGPLDNGFLLLPVDSDRVPRAPFGAVAVPVEVKNIREWVYPQTQELYQLLLKGVRLQEQHASTNITPVFVCRRLHKTTTFMAKDLGFFAIDSRRHYLPEHSKIEPALLDELRDELGITDLVQGTDSTGRIEAGLAALQHKYDFELATDRWRRFSSDQEFVGLLEKLHATRSPRTRADAMAQLRAVTSALGAELGW